MRLVRSLALVIVIGSSFNAEAIECPVLSAQQKAAVSAIVKDFSEGKISDTEMKSRIEAIMPIECLEVAVPPEGD